jgi:hypothetical protein
VIRLSSAPMTADRLLVGDETYGRKNQGGPVSISSGAMQLGFLTATRTELTTQARFVSGGVAIATPTLIRYGLYSVAANGDGTLVASTASDVTLFAATNTGYSKAWTTPFTKVAGVRYALGCLVVATTAGSLTGLVFSPGFTVEPQNAPRVAGRVNSLADLPASFTEAGMVSTTLMPYAVVLP